MANLSDRVGRLEATIPSGCVACDERSRTIHVGEDSGPATCPGCGRPIDVERFTIQLIVGTEAGRKGLPIPGPSPFLLSLRCYR